MGQTEMRLKELRIELPNKNRKGQGVVSAKRAGDYLYVSAQLPIDSEGKSILIGRVGTDLTREEGYAAARQCAVNALSVIRDYVGDLDHVESVVKVLGLVNSGGDFSEQPFVMNGFSDLIMEVFGERGLHARSAMGAYNLPLNSPVSVDCIVKIR